MNNRKPCPEVIFLDVNKALLDLALLKVSVTQAPDRRGGTAGLWSSMMLRHFFKVIEFVEFVLKEDYPPRGETTTNESHS